MLVPLVLFALAAAPSPRVLPDADFALHLPSVTAAKPQLAFFSRAGQRSAVLDPRTWSADLHPLLRLDLTHPETFTAAGLDPSGPASLSVRGDLKLTCTRVSDPKRFEDAAGAQLRADGEPWTGRVGEIVLHGAKVQGEVQVGYVRVGQAECAAVGPGAERTLRYAAQWLTSRWPSTPSLRGLSGTVFALRSGVVVGLGGDASTLQVHGRAAARVALSPKGKETFALPTSGLLRARGTFTPRALAHAARRLLALRCPTCKAARLDALESALDQAMTGEALLRVDRFAPTGPLSSPGGQFSALRLASVARLKSAARVRKALDALTSRAGSGPPDRWRFPIRGGAIELGISGELLYVSNDPTARDRALAAARDHRTPAHALELASDPALLADGLGRISLLDAISDQRLAAAFAFATQAVAILRASRSLHGWADPSGGAVRFGGTWRLATPER